MERKVTLIRKRDGRIVPFDKSKIADAVFKAAQAIGGQDRYLAEDLAEAVTMFLEKEFADRVPSVEEIQDLVERVLIKTGHARTARAYILYRERRARARPVRAGVTLEDLLERGDRLREIRELSLSVRRSDERIVPWDRERVVSALVTETGLSRNIAEVIVLEVEDDLVAAKARSVSSALVREMVNAKLAAYGLDEARRRHARLGIPVHDLRRLLAEPAGGSAELSRRLGDHLKREFALVEVFSQDVADAHLRGDMHINGLDGVDRLDAVSASAVEIASLGRLLPGGRPPGDDAFTLVRLVSDFLVSAASGPASWENVETLFSPLLSRAEPAAAGRDFRERAVLPLADGDDRRGRLSFSCGVAGEEEGRAVRVVREALAGEGRLLFPLAVLARRPGTLGAAGILDEGLPATPLSLVLGDGPFWRFPLAGAGVPVEGTLQAVTLNLPRLCLLNGGGLPRDRDVERVVALAARAFLQKRAFLSGLPGRQAVAGLAVSDLPCRLLVTGLWDAATLLTGKEPAEDDAAAKLCLDLLGQTRSTAARIGQKEGVVIRLCQNTAGAVAERLATLDGARAPYANSMGGVSPDRLPEAAARLVPLQDALPGGYATLVLGGEGGPSLREAVARLPDLRLTLAVRMSDQPPVPAESLF